MNEIIFDIETDGLKPTKIHCLSYDDGDERNTLYDYDDIRQLFKRDAIFIGHDICRYDIPVVERLVGVKVEGRLIDTLAVSWYLYPLRPKHGLESWGSDFDIPKVQIHDWEFQSIDDYTKRCVRDVEITRQLWGRQKDGLSKIYGGDLRKILDYLNFKMKCAALAESSGWKVDEKFTQFSLEKLQTLLNEKTERLSSIMPEVKIYRTKTAPVKPYKKDGSLSASGKLWHEECEELGLDPMLTEEIELLSKVNPPNPGSHSQVKEWLFSLGWEPCTYKQNKKKVEVPQITKIGESELTPSVELLAEKHPQIAELADYYTIKHRLSVVESFVTHKDEDGFITASIGGLTNTLRFKHTAPAVNLPGVDKPYGEYVRPCLIAPEGFEICGSDMKALEDRTKQHYIFPHDPEYVRQMDDDDFDPHLDIALLGGMMSDDEVKLYQSDPDHPPKELKLKRHGAKATNYSCTYGAFPPKIARSAGISIDDAEKLWAAYWERNWSISKVAEEVMVVEVDGQKWLYNPVSQLYYSLRHKKDIFSTLNQGTGSYCFDVWIGFVLKRREQITAQFHDEGVWVVKKGHREKMTEILRQAIDDTNAFLSLNKQLDIDIKFGDNYGEVH